MKPSLAKNTQREKKRPGSAVGMPDGAGWGRLGSAGAPVVIGLRASQAEESLLVEGADRHVLGWPG